MTTPPAHLPVGQRLLPLPAEVDRLAQAHPDDAVATCVARYLLAAACATGRYKRIGNPRAWFRVVVVRRVVPALADAAAWPAIWAVMAEQLAIWVDRDLPDDIAPVWADLTALAVGAPTPAAEGLALLLGHPLGHAGDSDCAIHAAVARGDWAAVCELTDTPPALLVDLHRGLLAAGAIVDYDL